MRQKPRPEQCEIVFPNAVGLSNLPVVRAEVLEFRGEVAGLDCKGIECRAHASLSLLEDPP